MNTPSCKTGHKHICIELTDGIYGTGIVIPCVLIHPYYTPKFTKFQAILAKRAFFVNYDDFYVAMIMLTSEIRLLFSLSFLTIQATSWGPSARSALNIGFARALAKPIL